MSDYITTTKVRGASAQMNNGTGPTVGSSGRMSLADIRRAPEETNEFFQVAAATFSNGQYVANVPVASKSENPQHKEDFTALLGAAAKARSPKGRT